MSRWMWAIVAAVGVGCGGGDSSGPIQGSCVISSAACIDYSGASAANAQGLPGVCAESNGTWNGGGCPTASRVGTCTFANPGLTQQMRFYTTASATPAQMAASCTTQQIGGVNGTWSNG